MPVNQVPPPRPTPGPQRRTVVTAGGGVLLACSVALTGFLATWESGGQKPVLKVYADQLAQGLPTVCHGLTRHVTSTPIVVGEIWTEERCAVEEGEALFKVQTALAKCLKRADVPQSVFDGASSHAWNNGAPNTCASLAVQSFNAGRWAEGCRRLSLSDAGRPVWSSVRTGRKLPNGQPEFKFVQGLANRRAAETTYCGRDL